MVLIVVVFCVSCFFFFKQKTAYELRLSLVGSEIGISDRFDLARIRLSGEVDERTKARFSKSRTPNTGRGFESRPLRHGLPYMERCWSGRTGTPGKRVEEQFSRGFESRPLRQI